VLLQNGVCVARLCNIAVRLQMEVRSAASGEVLFRRQLEHSVVAVASADLRGAGHCQVLVCLANGEVRGYSSEEPPCATVAAQKETEALEQVCAATAAARQAAGSPLWARWQSPVGPLAVPCARLPVACLGIQSVGAMRAPQPGAAACVLRRLRLRAASRPLLLQVLQSLEQKKRECTQEVHLLAQNLADTAPTAASLCVGDLIPPDTSVGCTVRVDSATQQLQCVVSTSNHCVIKGVILFAESLFPGESFFVHPDTPSPTVAVPVSPAKDCAVDMLVKVRPGIQHCERTVDKVIQLWCRHNAPGASAPHACMLRQRHWRATPPQQRHRARCCCQRAGVPACTACTE
jgi:hypothetical protein